MYEPERPDALVSVRPARLEGWARRFDKRSRTRGCPRHLASDPDGVPGFVEGDVLLSLVLGTVPGPGLDGLLLRYRSGVEEDLLTRLSAREGPGYRRAEVVVDGVRAVTWLTDPTSSLIVELDLATKARVLAAATPLADVDGRARGSQYLLGVQRSLTEHGLRDPYIDGLVARL